MYLWHNYDQQKCYYIFLKMLKIFNIFIKRIRFFLNFQIFRILKKLISISTCNYNFQYIRGKHNWHQKGLIHKERIDVPQNEHKCVCGQQAHLKNSEFSTKIASSNQNKCAVCPLHIMRWDNHIHNIFEVDALHCKQYWGRTTLLDCTIVFWNCVFFAKKNTNSPKKKVTL